MDYKDYKKYFLLYNRISKCREFLIYEKNATSQTYRLDDQLHNIHMLPAATYIFNEDEEIIIKKMWHLNGVVYNNREGYCGITYIKSSIDRTIHREHNDILDSLYIVYMEREWQIIYHRRVTIVKTWIEGRPVVLNPRENPLEKLLYDAILKKVGHIK